MSNKVIPFLVEGILCKHCSTCKELKPVLDFYKDNKNFSGYESQCKKCRIKKGVAYSKSHPDQKKQYYQNHKESLQLDSKLRHAAARLKVLQYYSHSNTPYCSCCKINILEFLALDHANNNGAEHRKEIGTGNTIYFWIIKNNFPDGFRILCHNCNLSLGFYGYCPHNKN